MAYRTWVELSFVLYFNRAEGLKELTKDDHQTYWYLENKGTQQAVTLVLSIWQWLNPRHQPAFVLSCDMCPLSHMLG